MKNLKMMALPCLLFLNVGVIHADVVVIMSAKSIVSSMNQDQVSAIFLGKTATYPDGSQAVPVDQKSESTQRDEFHSKVTGKSGAQLRAYWAKQVFSGKGTPPKEVPGPGDVKNLVAVNPNMIGYIDKSAVDESVKIVFSP